MGKALDLDTPLATPGGWTTMGQVQPGDRLFDERGEPCLVTAVSPVMLGRDAYRVEFCEGSSIVADADHLWTVGEAIKIKGKLERLTRTLTTRQMIEEGVHRSTGAAKFSVPLTAPIRTEANALPVDPYILGAWLGDGTSANAALTVGHQDLAEMVSLVEARGIGSTSRPAGAANRVSIFTINETGARVARDAADNLHKQLRLIGVLRNKQIPISYLRAAEQDRWSLLRGLMDTDGSAGGTACEFGVKSDALASGMVELLCSLGFRPRRTIKTLADGYVVHVVRFYAYQDQPVFGLTRKQAALPVETSASRRHLNRQRYIRAIVPVASRPVKCVQVSSASRLYLAGDRMIPTHNSELATDVIGNRLDTSPVPMAYIMPSDKTLKEIIEPRIKELMATPALAAKCGRRQTLAKKMIAGVRLRLVPAGSAASLAADSLGLVVTDEIDKFAANVKGQGGVVGLADRRGDAYSDFVHFSTSSPTYGPTEIELDPVSGLYFWADVDRDELRSPIWAMWQSGTRYHWAWPCPHCSTYSIPRFRDVKWDKPKDRDGNELRSSASMARRTAYMVCETCVEKIVDEHKEWMNARGVFVAPGQTIDQDGNVQGDPPDAWTLSFWVSGFCSPFVPWGQRCAEWIEASQSGKMDDLQTVVNGFAELFVPGNGEVPDWAELKRLKDSHLSGEIPDDVRLITLTVDVQKDRLFYVIRGWGEAETSWLIEASSILGDTSTDEKDGVWDLLGKILLGTYEGLPIRLALIDSGYRPGKKFMVPDHLVYKFCRKFPGLAYATKGASNTMRKPIVSNKIDVKIDGKEFKRGLQLQLLDTGFFKRWLMLKLKAPTDRPGGWYVPKDVSDDYLKQLVSEVEVTMPSGKRKWIQRSKHNHFFDCFDPETEVLTDAGWVPIGHAGEAMKFATVNLETDQIEFQLATGFVSRHHVGEMVSIKGRRIDALVTPTHRMVVSRYGSAPKIALAGEIDIWDKLKLTGTWSGNDVPVVRVGDDEINAGDWAEFLGWYVSEGHRCKGSPRNFKVVITQDPGEKQQTILRLLDRLPWCYRLSGGRQMVINSEHLYHALDDCYVEGDGHGCYRKQVPAVVKEMSSRLIERFIQSAVLGDGWVQNGFRTYATTSKVLADGVQELFLKLGNCSSIAERVRPNWSIRSKTGQARNQFHVSETKSKYATLRKSDNTSLISRVEYDGMVHCVTVPNGTLIVRRRGRAFVAGNCEAMQGAIAMMLNLKLLSRGPRMIARRKVVRASTRRPIEKADPIEFADERQAPPAQTEAMRPGRAKPRRSEKESIWR